MQQKQTFISNRKML